MNAAASIARARIDAYGAACALYFDNPEDPALHAHLTDARDTLYTLTDAQETP